MVRISTSLEKTCAQSFLSMFRPSLPCLATADMSNCRYSDLCKSNLERNPALLAGGQHCQWLRTELAGVLWCHCPPVLLLALPLRLGGCSHRSHVHCLPVCFGRLRGSPPHRCPHPWAAIQCHGLPHNLRHRICPTLFRSRIRASDEVVSVWPAAVGILSGGLVVYWWSLVEVHWAVVSRELPLR